jgi:hypothetical protein
MEAGLTRKEKPCLQREGSRRGPASRLNEQQGATQRYQVWDENEDEKIQTGGEEIRFLKEKRRRRRRRNLTLKKVKDKKKG